MPYYLHNMAMAIGQANRYAVLDAVRVAVLLFQGRGYFLSVVSGVGAVIDAGPHEVVYQTL